MAEVDVNVVSFAGKGKKWDGEADVQEVVDAISGTESLEEIQLTGNTLGLPAMCAVSNALAKKPSLKAVLLADVFTGRLNPEIHPALVHLGDTMLHLGNLQTLDLSDNAVSLDGAKSLYKFLSQCTTLQELLLNNTGVGSSGGQIIGRALLSAAKKGLKLKKFVLGRSRLENKGAIAISNAFKEMQSLEHISMPQNGIRHRGISALAEGLACNSELEHLDLNDNAFSRKGSSSMGHAFTKMGNLKTLNLGDCLLKKFVENFSTLLSMSKLEVLDLTYNDLGNDSASVLGPAVIDHGRMRRLELNGNKLSEDAVEALRGAMASVGGVLGETDEMDDEADDDEDEDEEGNEESDEESDDEEELKQWGKEEDELVAQLEAALSLN